MKNNYLYSILIFWCGLLSANATNSPYASTERATKHIKEQYQKLFQKQSKAQELFDYMGEAKFQNTFGVEDVDDFLDVVVPDLSNNSLYGFIKVKYNV